jgi:hypothetical protein
VEGLYLFMLRDIKRAHVAEHGPSSDLTG